LTKLFETIHSLPLPEALDWLKADPNRQRGEFVLMLSGATAGSDSGEGERVLKLLLADGLPTKQAAKLRRQHHRGVEECAVRPRAEPQGAGLRFGRL
jgi:16S rRNA C1402 (ribose-2'-O) methylase RsmI